MECIKKAIALFLACVAVLFIPLVPDALELTTEEIAALANGKLLKKRLPESCQNGFYGGTGLTVIDAPAKIVWNILRDWEAYPEIFPRTLEAKELSRKADHSLIRFKLGYKILNVKYHLNVVQDTKSLTLSFNLVKNHPHDIEGLKGSWRLLPQSGDRTLVVYTVAAQAPIGIVNFLGKKIEQSLERSLIGLPKYLKTYLEGPLGSQYRQEHQQTPEQPQLLLGLEANRDAGSGHQ